MMRWVLIAMTLLAAQVAQAEPIKVRSGEHDGFTRLVLRLPERTRPEVDRSGQTARIRFSSPFELDTGDVFSRIATKRLADISARSGELRVSLGCACKIETFVERGNLLVIDIVDRKERVGPPRIASRPLPQNLRYRYDGSGGSERAARVRAAASPPGETKQRVDPVPAAPARLDPFQRPDFSREVSAAEDRLLAHLRRAKDQGLVRAADLPKAATSRPTKTIGSAPAPDTATPEETHVRAATSIDQSGASPSASRRISANGAACIPDDQLDLMAWSDGRPFAAQIAERRNMASTDDPTAAANLARTYLHFGFGTEAIAVLTEAGEDLPVLTAMAAILDDVPDPARTIFAGQESCAGDAALWGALILETAEPAAINMQALRLAFARLPKPVQRHLAPELAGRLVSAGAAEDAAAILDLARSGETDDTARHALAKADIAAAEGDARTAERALQDAKSAPVETAAQALVRSVDADWTAGVVVAAETPALLESYIRELRGTPVVESLRHALVRAHTSLGDFDAAIDTAETAVGELQLDADTSAAWREEVMASLVRTGGDLTFIEIVLPRLRTGTRVPLPSDHAIAARLIDLGFPQEAMSLLRDAGPGETAHERRLLRAEAALAQDQPELALLQLAGLDAARAHELRGRAHARLGKHEEAARSFAAAGDEDAADRQIWLASDPERPEGPDPVAGGGPLSQAAALLEQSAAVRTEIGGLIGPGPD